MRNLARGFRPLVMFVAGGLFTLTVVGGVALAQDDTIEACVKSNGEVRIVDGAGDCKDNETPLSWNITGPVGPVGPAGPEGPSGPTEFSLLSVLSGGTFDQIRGDDVVSVSQPFGTGRYLITFDHEVANCAKSVVSVGIPIRATAILLPPDASQIVVTTISISDATLADGNFELTVSC
jgi:hypothetical protein